MPTSETNPVDPKTLAEDEDVRHVLVEGTDEELESFLTAVREPADLAECLLLIQELPRRRYVFGRLPEDVASDVLAHLEEDEREDLLKVIAVAKLGRLLGEMESDDAADVVGELSDERRTEVLARIPDEERMDVELLLDYPEDTAGGLMQREFVAVSETTSVGDAVAQIRAHVEEEEIEDVACVFVTDADGHLVGQVPLVQLVLTPDQAPVSRIVDRDEPIIHVDEDQEDVARTFQKYDLLAAGVVDAEGRLIGQITIDDVVDVIEEEVEEDLLKQVGAAESDFVYSGNILKISGARLGWLVANLCGGMIAAYMISIFTHTLKSAISLVAFIPVIMSMGGNVGIQSSTIAVRGFATGKLRGGNLRAIVLKELVTGMFMGVVCGTGVAIVASIWKGNPWLGVIVGLAMIVAVTVASVVGTTLPTVFRRLGADPAIAAGPFVTTSIDITSILIYFMIATALLKHLQ